MIGRIARYLPSPGGAASALLGFVILVAIWWGTTAIFDTRPVILPSPPAVGRSLAEMVSTGSLGIDVTTSLTELFWGFLIGTALGLATGFALARSAALGAFLDPIVESFRFILPFSMVPLLVVWFGVSIIGKIFVVAYACYFVVAINTAAAIASVDPLTLKAARMLGISGSRMLLRVVLPAALPRILTGLQVAIAYAWVSVIAAEYIGAQAGLGYMITNAQAGLETDKVIAGMVVIGVIGLALSQAVALLRRLSIPYQRSSGW
ncbi:MAG: ABC transporter permease [Rhizobiaceae bacterium]|jgi:ABC-type nitrate/sulfonate/bicarbonate transport system permease component